MNPFANSLTASTWTGQHLGQALTETPQMVLSFYTYGVLLRQKTAHGYTEYPIHPDALAQALATHIRFDTGVMGDDILLMRREGVTETLVSYRKPQKTGIWLEGSSEPLRVCLPPLLLLRQHRGTTPTYALYAVKQRPKTLDVALFHAPLPNVYPHASICWGNVRQLGTSIAEDWTLLLGSPFGNHSVFGKSVAHPHDIRPQLLHLAHTHTRTYPKRDLIPAHKTLQQVLDKEIR